jgi:hypothetical protein
MRAPLLSFVLGCQALGVHRFSYYTLLEAHTLRFNGFVGRA